MVAWVAACLIAWSLACSRACFVARSLTCLTSCCSSFLPARPLALLAAVPAYCLYLPTCLHVCQFLLPSMRLLVAYFHELWNHGCSTLVHYRANKHCLNLVPGTPFSSSFNFGTLPEPQSQACYKISSHKPQHFRPPGQKQWASLLKSRSAISYTCHNFESDLTSAI